jgi:hypothetical protein
MLLDKYWAGTPRITRDLNPGNPSPPCETDEINKYSFTFLPSTGFGGFVYYNSERTLIASYPIGSGDPPPIATPEPSDLLLLGTVIVGLGFVRKFTSSGK